MIFSIAAELSFTFYTDVFDIFNVTRHIFKIVSFYCSYKALIENSLTNPLNVLFSDLKKQEENLKTKNEKLIDEISNREKTESDLKQITRDLSKANAKMISELRQCNYEKEILREQLEYYVKIIEQSQSDISGIID
jgi:hypothetical protein